MPYALSWTKLARFLPQEARRAATEQFDTQIDAARRKVLKCLRSAMHLVTFILVLVTAEVWAQPSIQRGLNLVRANCARCHAIDKVSESPLKIAPPLRELHKRYPVESLQEAFAEGIQTGHDNMPEFRLAPDQIGDLIAYLKTLER